MFYIFFPSLINLVFAHVSSKTCNCNHCPRESGAECCHLCGHTHTHWFIVASCMCGLCLFSVTLPTLWCFLMSYLLSTSVGIEVECNTSGRRRFKAYQLPAQSCVYTGKAHGDQGAYWRTISLEIKAFIPALHTVSTVAICSQLVLWGEWLVGCFNALQLKSVAGHKAPVFRQPTVPGTRLCLQQKIGEVSQGQTGLHVWIMIRLWISHWWPVTGYNRQHWD